MRTWTVTVRPEFAGRTVKFCLRRELGLTDRQISRLKWQPGGITCNGSPVRTNETVTPGDVLNVCVGERRPGGAFAPADVPVEVLYEDEDLLIVNKPAGLAVHGRSEKGDPTLGSALAHRYGAQTVFHPVNRLDKDTSGAMVVAKNGLIHDRLRRQLHTPDFVREYLALAEGTGFPPTGEIDAPLGPSGDGWKQWVCPEGKPARTRYETVAVGTDWTLLRVRPETGRTHQIRVHFAALGHPLLGDKLYGGEQTRLHRQGLHSSRVRLTHPVTGETVEAAAPLPEDLARVMGGMYVRKRLEM